MIGIVCDLVLIIGIMGVEVVRVGRIRVIGEGIGGSEV